MNQLQIFESPEFGKVRTVTIDGEPWFVGKDVATILGYQRATKAIADHVDEEDRDGVPIQDSIGRMQQTPIINESGLYSLILSSKLPSAKAFKSWITRIVIPSIRKYGGYVTKETLDSIFHNPENLHTFLSQMLQMTSENKRLKNKLELLAPKVEYFDHMMNSDLLVNFRTTAKEIGVKPLYFINFLLDKKYLYRNTRRELLPYQHYVEAGLFELVEFWKYGHQGVQTLVTPQGRQHFLQLYFDGEMEQGKYDLRAARPPNPLGEHGGHTGGTGSRP